MVMMLSIHTTCTMFSDENCKESASTDHRCLLQPSTASLMLIPAVENVVNNKNNNNSTSPNHTPAPAPPVGYGMGWFVRREKAGLIGGRGYPFTFSHTGGAVGACSVLTVMAREEEGCGSGVVVAVLFNLQKVKGVFELGTRIAEEFYNL